MKYKLILLLLLLPFQGFFSCNSLDEDDETEGNWTQETPFKGRPRSASVSFTIGENAYVGLGYDGDEYLSDFYEFNEERGFWQEVAEFPGTLRERAVAFSLNGKGYVVGGFNRDEQKEELGDTWMYDPATNNWSQKSNFGGTARYNALGFSINGLGYVGTGFDGDNYMNDFWEYNPSSDSWHEIISFRGQKREEAFSFIVDDRVFIGGGRNNGLYQADLWEFDAITGNWQDISIDDDDDEYGDFSSAVRRIYAVTFVISGKAYIGTGSNGQDLSSFWEFDPIANTYESVTDFEGASRVLANSFVIGGRPYVLTGQSGTRMLDDMWSFDPEAEYDENE